jgi:hypothetical protein
MLRKGLLLCGVLAAVVYVAADVLAAIVHPGYHSFGSQMISELMAIGAPTERLVDPFFLLYGVLMMAFAAGVWMSAPGRRGRVAAVLLFAYAAIGELGPTVAEMNLRGSPPSAQDGLHIALTAVLVALILAAMAAAAPIRGRRFRRYTLVSMALLVGLGGLAGIAGRGVAAGQPTPWFGLVERLDIGVLLLWVAVLARALHTEKNGSSGSPRRKPLRAGALNVRQSMGHGHASQASPR